MTIEIMVQKAFGSERKRVQNENCRQFFAGSSSPHFSGAGRVSDRLVSANLYAHGALFRSVCSPSLVQSTRRETLRYHEMPMHFISATMKIENGLRRPPNQSVTRVLCHFSDTAEVSGPHCALRVYQCSRFTPVRTRSIRFPSPAGQLNCV